jgi:nitrite reductase/ring-hydroxylating ferredoxin subunit
MTRIAGHAAGKLLRRYWQPVALVDEMQGERPVKAVRLVREPSSLQTQTGYSLMQRHCPHRGADLAYMHRTRRLRCSFHGWKFDAAGRCIETPAEPESSRLCDHIKTVSPLSWRRAASSSPTRRGAAPAFPLRLLRRARRLHLRLQGLLGLQLAAGAGGRHRPGARLIGCTSTSRTRTRRELRQAVPRQAGRLDLPISVLREHDRPGSASSAPTTACACRRCGGSARAQTTSASISCSPGLRHPDECR